MAHKILAAKPRPPPSQMPLPVYYYPPPPPPTRPKDSDGAILSIIALIVAAIILFALFNPGAGPSLRYVVIEVDYSARWGGLIMIETEQSSFAANGYERASINVTRGTFIYISAQKMEWGFETLYVKIYSDGVLVKSSFTNAEFGIASVSWTVT